MKPDNLLGGRTMNGIQYGGKTYIEEPDVRRAVQAALATNEKRNKRIDALEGLLRRIRQWDMLDAAADGAYWKGEIDKLIAEGREVVSHDNYVAWMRFVGGKEDDDPQRIEVCDSDDPGAFKVYRHPSLEGRLLERLKWTRDRWQDVMEDVAEYAQQTLGKPIAEVGGLVGGFHAVASNEIAACDGALKGEGYYARDEIVKGNEK